MLYSCISKDVRLLPLKNNFHETEVTIHLNTNYHEGWVKVT